MLLDLITELITTIQLLASGPSPDALEAYKNAEFDRIAALVNEGVELSDICVSVDDAASVDDGTVECPSLDPRYLPKARCVTGYMKWFNGKKGMMCCFTKISGYVPDFGGNGQVESQTCLSAPLE